MKYDISSFPCQTQIIIRIVKLQMATEGVVSSVGSVQLRG